MFAVYFLPSISTVTVPSASLGKSTPTVEFTPSLNSGTVTSIL